MPWANTLSELLRAGLATVQDQPDAARKHLEQSITLAGEAGMELHAAAARWRLGHLVGGSEGEDLVHQANRFIGGQDVANAPRLIAMLAPGFSD